MAKKQERAHAVLSASSAERWIYCPPSARLQEQFPEETSEYAEEGTLAHAVCELKLRRIFLEPGMTDRTFNARLNKLKKHELYKPEMLRFTDEYVDYVKEIAYSYPVSPSIAVEKRVDYSHIAPEGFGTADCIIIHGDELHVIDFKYGQGVPVRAEGNPQLALYALGAVATYSMIYGIRKVALHVIQPRLRQFSRWDTTARELEAWGKWVKERADLAWKGEGDFHQGIWCRFCRAAASCRHRADVNLSLENHTAVDEKGAEVQYPIPPLLSNEEVGRILGRAQHLADWVKKLEKYALNALVKGDSIPGWKIVEGRSNRTIMDVDTAYTKLQEAGYAEALLYNRVPVSLTEAEKLISREDYEQILSRYVQKPKGKPTLAPEEDRRPAYQPAVSAEEAFGGDNTYKEEVKP